MTLVDDPTDPDGLHAPPTIDAEGLATRRNVLIDGGVLQGVRAQHLQRPAAPARVSTGSAVRGGFKSTPGVGCPAAVAAPGHARRRPS